jgi:hypothetical protein
MMFSLFAEEATNAIFEGAEFINVVSAKLYQLNEHEVSIITAAKTRVREDTDELGLSVGIPVSGFEVLKFFGEDHVLFPSVCVPCVSIVLRNKRNGNRCFDCIFLLST